VWLGEGETPWGGAKELHPAASFSLYVEMLQREEEEPEEREREREREREEREREKRERERKNRTRREREKRKRKREIAKETGLDCMGEDAEDEGEDEDADDGGDATTPPVHAPPAAAPEEIIKEEGPVKMLPAQEAPVVHEVILPDAAPKLLQPRLYRMLMRDYEESLSRMMDDLDDLDDPTKASSDLDEWFPEDGSNDRD
jgi:hypothetical protein